jgi:transposase
MNLVPVAGIDVGKRFSEMAVLSPSNEVYARIRINHDSYTNFERLLISLKKRKRSSQ